MLFTNTKLLTIFPPTQYFPLIGNIIFICLFLLWWGFNVLCQSNNNLILIIIGLELTLLSLSFLFILYSLLWKHFSALVIVFVLLTLGGAESSLGLALTMVYYSIKKSIELFSLIGLKH